ncbi:MAG TPA: response regulator transcription factor [Polyangiaceae bacterium]|nr:response regulator transcription factor [Polyangiaceae bacterium]
MNPPLILLVEDEVVMRRVLIVALRSQGYAVLEAESGAQALQELQEQTPQAMILDLGLPDIDGVEVATQVRRDHAFPIIVLSARDEEHHQIRALDAGANDYVTKPFREGELMARLRAALRHAPRLEERSQIVLGDLRLEVVQRRVFVRDVEVDLTSTQFKLLHLLACDIGRVVTHRQLLRAVWGPSREEEVQYLRVYMKQLRGKLEDDPSQPRRIVTTPGVGYRLVQMGA